MATNLIIGGTGKTGRRVASRLQDRGLPVTSLSRPEFDWSDPTTWSSVEQPATAAYITFAPDLTFPGAPDGIFMQNFDEGVFAPALEAGHFRFSAGAVREPFLDVEDVVDVAAAS